MIKFYNEIDSKLSKLVQFTSIFKKDKYNDIVKVIKKYKEIAVNYFK